MSTSPKYLYALCACISCALVHTTTMKEAEASEGTCLLISTDTPLEDMPLAEQHDAVAAAVSHLPQGDAELKASLATKGAIFHHMGLSPFDSIPSTEDKPEAATEPEPMQDNWYQSEERMELQRAREEASIQNMNAHTASMAAKARKSNAEALLIEYQAEEFYRTKKLG